MPLWRVYRVMNYKFVIQLIRQVAADILQYRPDQFQSYAEEVDRVCIILGTYRNLTTLTASIASTHPNVQVLNHGAPRIYIQPQYNFIRTFSQTKFARFLSYALFVSLQKQRGDMGGSILYSHAYDREGMKNLYHTHGAALGIRKKNCIVWKDSLSIAKRLRRYQFPFDKVFESNSSLCFLLPVRNPLDTTSSNLKTGHHKRLQGKPDTFEGVLQGVLAELEYGFQLHKKYPERVYILNQHDIDQEALGGLQKYLNVQRLDAWEKDVLSYVSFQDRYTYTTEQISLYRKLVTSIISDESYQQLLLKYVPV